MTNQAVVIYPGTTKRAEAIEWQNGKLLSFLYETIGCDCVDSGPLLQTHVGEMIFWVDDTGLVNGSAPEYNDYAIGIARACGWPVAALAGVVVVTGGYDCVGHTLGLSEPLADLIVATVADAAERAGQEAGANGRSVL